MNMLRKTALLASVLCLFCVAIATAQTDPAAGILPFSTQVGGPYDFIDLATSNISAQIPVRNKAGKIPFAYSLRGNSHAYIYQPATIGSPTMWGVTKGFSFLGFGASAGPAATRSTMLTCSGRNITGTAVLSSMVWDSTGAG